jgi:hypothetical protein
LVRLVEREWSSSQPEGAPSILWRAHLVPYDQELKVGLLPAGESFCVLSFDDSFWTLEFARFLNELYPRLEVRAAWKSLCEKEFSNTFTIPPLGADKSADGGMAWSVGNIDCMMAHKSPIHAPVRLNQSF